LPRGIVEHLKDRIQQRQISLDGLKRLEQWKHSEPEAPEGYWFKDFGDFILCGHGETPSTVLAAGMAPHDEEIE
jgi:hypothetical protein